MPPQKPKIGIFILCYRVESKIYDVLSSIPTDVYERTDIIAVIDNDSSDQTIARAKQAVLDHRLSKVRILKNNRNYGYGGSHKVAFDFLKQCGMDYGILLHGDGQGDLQALRELIRHCDEDQYQFVIGSRFMETKRLDQRYSKLRVFANFFFVGLQAVISGNRITDPGSGEVAYDLRFLAQSKIPYHQLTDQFHFTPQLLLYCSKMPIRFKEFPLHWGEVEISSVNIWEHGWNMLKMLLEYRLRGIELTQAKSAKDYESRVVFTANSDSG